MPIYKDGLKNKIGAQWIKVFAAQLNDLSWVFRAYMMDRETLSVCPLTSVYIHVYEWAHTQTQRIKYYTYTDTKI